MTGFDENEVYFKNWNKVEKKVEKKDRLDVMFELQAQLDITVRRNHGKVPTVIDDATATQNFEMYGLAMIDEVMEAIRLTHWKWWKKYNKSIDREALLEEIVDIEHFKIALCQSMNFSTDDLYKAFVKKNEINQARQRGEVPGREDYKA